MMYLAAIFVSPLYFLIRRRWLALIFNSIFYLIALGLLITIVGAPFAFVPWIIAATQAVWDLRKQLFEEQATAIAAKMAQTMDRANRPPA